MTKLLSHYGCLPVCDAISEIADTDWLGDLYQHDCEDARKGRALVQTPDFVADFLLERTLDPAVQTFGLDGFRFIDPACGPGHIVVRAFCRLFSLWRRQRPETPLKVVVQKCLESACGVDIDPVCVALCRSRLLLAAGELLGGIQDMALLTKSFAPRVACGDSLLGGRRKDELPQCQPENLAAYELLQAGTYHAVVANPPYITPRDKEKSELYRQRWKACHRKYSLAVPFAELIFELAVEGGFTGQITANSFMKREFGKKLIEEFFPTVDLTHVIDTSGAYIPGHGTPTVILLGRNRSPVLSTVRTVMGIRGEPQKPERRACEGRKVYCLV